MTRLLIFTLLVVSGVAIAQTEKQANPTRTHSLTGHIVSHEGFESKILGNKRDVLVYLPPDYDQEPNRHYPVLYLQDGQNVFDGYTSYIPNEEWRADEAAQALIQAHLIEPIIMVAVANAGMARADEYLPTRWTPDATKMPLMGGKADLYGRMLTDELMPFIDHRYRTKKGPENTAIAGSSLGAIVSLHLGVTHPNVFGKLGLFSPSLWWQDGLLTKNIQALPKKLKSKIWVDLGTQEGETSLPDTLKLRDALIGKGWIAGKNLAVYVDGFAHHNERAWANRFPAFLMFLYGRH